MYGQAVGNGSPSIDPSVSTVPLEMLDLDGVLEVLRARGLEASIVPGGVARGGGAGSEIDRWIRVGALELDLGAKTVRVDDRLIELPPKEFRILTELATRHGEPVTTEELLACVWPETSWMTARDVYWHMWRLRRLLGEMGDVCIVNRRGFGYVLTANGALR